MFLFQFRNYFKYLWQRWGNSPRANLKKSDYRVVTLAYFFLQMSLFLLNSDTIDTLCLVYSNFCEKKIMEKNIAIFLSRILVYITLRYIVKKMFNFKIIYCVFFFCRYVATVACIFFYCGGIIFY